MGASVVVITGAGRGIGRALALYFAEHGWVVIIIEVNAEVARETEALIRRHSPSSIAYVADIRDEERIMAVLEEVHTRHGHIDALINNAGITDREHRQILELPSEMWREIISVNLTGTFLVLKSCARLMVSQGAGNIVNVTSLLAQRGQARAGDAPYGVSKAGVEALTEYAAVELKPFGINVNAVYPGVMVDTGFFDHLPPQERAKLARPTILNELVYLLANLAPGELTGVSICALKWRENPELLALAERYLK